MTPRMQEMLEFINELSKDLDLDPPCPFYIRAIEALRNLKTTIFNR